MLKTNFYAQSMANISLRTNYADLKAIFEDYNKITHNIKMKIKYTKSSNDKFKYKDHLKSCLKNDIFINHIKIK